MRRGILVSAVALALVIVGCDDDDDDARDAGMRDGAVARPDAARPDAAVRPDAGVAPAMLQEAFDAQLQVNRILTDPAILTEDAMRAAVLEATPFLQEAIRLTRDARTQLGGDADPFVGSALDEQQTAADIAAIIVDPTIDNTPVRFDELVVHGAVALTNLNLALQALGEGPSAPRAGDILTAAELTVPPGYTAEIVDANLSFASVVAVGDDGTVYVGESGFSYGLIRTEARVLRVEPDGTLREVANGFEGPLAGIAVAGDDLYVSHRGTVTRIALATGQRTDIVTDLPAFGDHFTENIAVGPDGRIYFTQGSVTNSGVVGLDNYFFGWLPQRPDGHDVACRDLRLAGVSFTTGNPLTEDVQDMATTGPYLPFGTPATPGQLIEGQTKCSGAVLVVNPDGTGLEVFADGFRNPYGLAFTSDGRLVVTENGPDARGSRPVTAPDNLYVVIEGGWYGFPDFYSGLPITDPSLFTPADFEPQLVLLDPPPLATAPMARFELHASANGLDFATNATFAPMDTAFVALFGDLAPNTSGGAELEAGQRVVTVDAAGEVSDFLTAGVDDDGDRVLRPTDATFDPTGTVLYVTHFGDVDAVAGGVLPTPETGALIAIRRE